MLLHWRLCDFFLLFIRLPFFSIFSMPFSLHSNSFGCTPLYLGQKFRFFYNNNHNHGIGNPNKCQQLGEKHLIRLMEHKMRFQVRRKIRMSNDERVPNLQSVCDFSKAKTKGFSAQKHTPPDTRHWMNVLAKSVIATATMPSVGKVFGKFSQNKTHLWADGKTKKQFFVSKRIGFGSVHTIENKIKFFSGIRNNQTRE